MHVEGMKIQGGSVAGGVRLRVYRNDNVFNGIAAPATWRLVSDVAGVDESDAGASIYRVPDFEVEPGGFYTFLWCYPDGRPMAVIFPEGLTAPVGGESMKLGEWYRWTRGTAAGEGATDGCHHHRD